MTIQTPEQIASQILRDTHSFPVQPTGADLRNLMERAIRTDRAQPIHPDWADDAERWGTDGCDVKITDAYGDTTDFGLNAAEVRGMFNGIGRAEA